MANKHKYTLDVFFYIKGSKDVPHNHPWNSPIGIDIFTHSGGTEIIQTSPFNSSLKDIYTKITGFREFDNLYSIKTGDEDQLIPVMADSNINNISLHRNKEYITKILVKQTNLGQDETNNYLNKINPNINIKYDKENKTYSIDRAENEADKIALEHKIFWQKMFTFFEFLKKEERAISNGTNNINQLNVLGYIDTIDKFYHSNDTTKIQNEINNIPNYFSKLTALYFGATDVKTVGETTGSTEDERYYYNPYRLKYLYGKTINTGELNPFNKNSPIEQFYKFEESLYFDRNKASKIKNDYGINIQYDKHDSSNDASVSQKGIERMSRFTFTLSYGANYENNEYKDIYTVTFNLYFDPDNYIASGYGSEKYEVWSYHDDDNDAHLDIENPQAIINGIRRPTFNKYDNDYANTFLPDGNVYRLKFIAHNDEMNNVVISKITNILKTGDYTNYVTMDISRHNPTLKDTEFKIKSQQDREKYGCEYARSIVWENRHIVSQRFYIFYKITVPTQEAIKSAIRDYLIELHKECNPTQHTKVECETVGLVDHVITIGHGTPKFGDANDKYSQNDFLSKMYPELFSRIELKIIPMHHKYNNSNIDAAYYNSGQINSQLYSSEIFNSCITPKMLVDTVRTVSPNFFLHHNGNTSGSHPEQTANPNNHYDNLSSEVIFLGGLNDSASSPNSNTTITFGKYSFPWFVVSTKPNYNLINPLTADPNFKNYKPRMFSDSTSGSYDAQLNDSANKLQFIMLKLCSKMFEKPTNLAHPENKPPLTEICGVHIEYERDDIYDVNINIKAKNIANFTLNAIHFMIYAQQGKYFTCG